jgi:large subunit ribosomal protein L13
MLRHALRRGAPAATTRAYLAPPRQRWHVIDAARGVSVGRLAAAIAPVLRGKHKPGFEPHRHEHGDNVVVVNADKLVFTGRTWKQKLYRHHSGFMGGLKERTAADVQRRKTGEVLRRAVLGMLPKNKLRTTYIRRLWIYAGPEHPHSGAQQHLAARPSADGAASNTPA